MSRVGRGLLLVLAVAGMGAVPSGAAERAEVTVAAVQAGERVPCGEVQIRGLSLEGGCELWTSEAEVELQTLNLFGDHDFATCSLAFRMHVGGNGELGVADVSINASPGPAGAACGDILACRRSFEGEESWEEKLPWRGRIVADGDGALTAEIDACFDTCAGRFEGVTRLTVVDGPRGLRLGTRRAALGLSGLEIGGRWGLEPIDGGELVFDAP